MPALVDTGASQTVVTPEAVEKTGLRQVDTTLLSRAGGTDPVDVFAASIQFPQGLAPIGIIRVLRADLPGHIQCLIGRDVLANWIFRYNGLTGYCEIWEQDLAAWLPEINED
jgi:predicted aspartyl protease